VPLLALSEAHRGRDREGRGGDHPAAGARGQRHAEVSRTQGRQHQRTRVNSQVVRRAGISRLA
jgi:hypothetical protein